MKLLVWFFLLATGTYSTISPGCMTYPVSLRHHAPALNSLTVWDRDALKNPFIVYRVYRILNDEHDVRIKQDGYVARCC